MDSRVDIYRLETGGTYQIVKSRKDTDLLDYVRDSSGRTRTYLLARPSLVAQRVPPKVNCWSKLQDYSPPRGEAAPRKWMIFAHGDDGIPLGLDGPLTKDERDQLLDDVELVSVQRAQSSASKDDAGDRWTGMAMTIIIALACLLTLVIIMIGLSAYLWSRDDAPELSQETTEYVVEPPSPDSEEVWQNPRPSP